MEEFGLVPGGGYPFLESWVHRENPRRGIYFVVSDPLPTNHWKPFPKLEAWAAGDELFYTDEAMDSIFIRAYTKAS